MPLFLFSIQSKAPDPDYHCHSLPLWIFKHVLVVFVEAEVLKEYLFGPLALSSNSTDSRKGHTGPAGAVFDVWIQLWQLVGFLPYWNPGVEVATMTNIYKGSRNCLQYTFTMPPFIRVQICLEWHWILSRAFYECKMKLLQYKLHFFK